MIATQKDSLGPSALTKGRAEAALAGTTLANRYDILELVGVGGMGAVYRARDRELDDLVALKVIRRELAAMPEMVERFRHEVKLARRVTHVNVARTFELGTSDGLMYCTMELVEGESLTQRLEQRRKLPIAEAVAISCAVCDGLATAHAANVIHRDIKPDNILLANDGRVVIADFGVAAVGVGMGKVGELSGTPAYMAPEQARGEAATPASDVYAVATVLYELVTGKRAFSGEAMTVLSAKQSVERLAPADGEVPPELATAIGQATARDPAQRTPTAVALRAALEPWAKGARDTMQPHRASVREADADLTTIVVLAPQVLSHPQLYLAEAVHEALLSRLGRMPRVRVLPRVSGRIEESVVGICLDLAEKFSVRITPPRGQTTVLELPLAVDQVDEAADSIAGALGAMLRPRKLGASEATDLLLRARHMLSRDFTRVPEGFAQLERAYELAPDDPRIVANYLIAKVRLAFFRSANPGMDESCALARAIVAANPDLADAHLAAGHVELAIGDPIAAARHFRAAIRCAPHLAESHEQLGRMLLEAGYMDAALARLDEAIAIAPNLRTARWEILRAYALDQRWAEFDVLLAELLTGGDRPLARSRYLWWRADWAGLATARAHITQMDRTLWPGMMESMFEVFLEGQWAKQRDGVIAAAHAPVESHRRTAFICQLAAEAAAFSQDVDAAISLTVRAIDKGLFDLHWLDHCTMLAPVRKDPRFAPLRRLVKERADAILDALYGDHVAISETVAQ